MFYDSYLLCIPKQNGDKWEALKLEKLCIVILNTECYEKHSEELMSKSCVRFH